MTFACLHFKNLNVTKNLDTTDPFAPTIQRGIKEWKYFDAGAIGFGVKTLVDLCERFREPVA